MPSKYHLVVFSSILFLALPASAIAMDAPPAESVPELPAYQERLPDEIKVTGRQTLGSLQQQIYQAQDRMFNLFNDLNDDDRYDIFCKWEAPTGTRIRQRVCMPRFLSDSIEDNGKAWLAESRGEMAMRVPPAQAEVDFRYPILKEKMEAIMEEHPELGDAFIEHYNLSEEFKSRTSSAASK